MLSDLARRRALCLTQDRMYPTFSDHLADQPATNAATAVTAWIDAHILPVHVGVYQRQFPGGPYSLWDGQAWHEDALTAAAAAGMPPLRIALACRWRGLANQPEPSDPRPPN